MLDVAGPDFSHGANLTDPALMVRLNEGRDARVAFADCGQALVSLLGESRALRLALLGEALDVAALADAVTVTGDPAGEAQRLARRLAAKPPLAARAILDVLRQSLCGGDVAAESDAQRWADTLESADFAEAMAAWYGRRAGHWKGR